MNKFIINILLLLSILGLNSCRDDFIDFFQNEGDEITLDLDFMPVASSELSTRAQQAFFMNGDGMSNIRDLCLVIFDEEGNYNDIIDISDLHYEENKNFDRTSADTSNGEATTEVTTIRRKYRLELETGNYYVYAVANLGEYPSDQTVDKTTYSYLVNDMHIQGMTREQFRAYRMKWIPSNYRDNSEMTGIVTVGSLPGNAVYTGDYDNDKPIFVRPGLKLHCWLRRLASKVTVDFDATNLDASTTIYLKEIRVRDIAADCPLFDKNMARHPLLGSENIPYDAPGGLMSNDLSSHGIRLCADNYAQSDDGSKDYKNWPFLTSGIPTLKEFVNEMDKPGSLVPAELKNRRDMLLKIGHSQTAPAIPFYENMQGRDEKKPKLADADLDGHIDSPDSYLPTNKDFKDQMPAGTYVEVIAYYHSLAKGNEGEGNIIYRFMLGKDVICDYNVERNYHYKLTLCFNGYANDIDWHIEYDREKPPYSMNAEYYISYGYNESMEYPITISGELVDNIITAEIIQNDWQPSQMWKKTKPVTIPNSAGGYSPYTNAADVTYPKDDARKVSLGFLSLRKPQNDIIGVDKTASQSDSHAYIYKAWSGGALDSGDKSRNSDTDNDILYKTNHDDIDYYDSDYKGKRSLGYRVYHFSNFDQKDAPTGEIYYDASVRKEYDEKEDGGFHLYTKKSDSKIYPRTTTFYLPMYTRERNICTRTGFTGENPYNNFQRRAKVRIRFKVKDNHNIVHSCDSIIDIIQVAKIGNPMGIWREWNNAAPFEVQLKYLEEDGVTYTDLTSHEGGWSAEVEQGSEWILLNGSRNKVTGNKGDKIKFTYRPIGVLSNKNQVRCGIITVRYHNFACVHKIFVRQGYAPLRISAGSPAFHTGNLITSSSEADNPCDEGSMFKCGNLTQPMDASNNVNDVTPWARVTPNMFKDHSTKDFVIAGEPGEPKKWSKINSYHAANNDLNKFAFGKVTIGEKTSRLLNVNDIIFLRDNFDSNTEMIRYQYGVMYGGKATKTGSTIDEAFHYKQWNPATHSYGMRGCFVYNNSDGKQIFFAIGSSGFGKWKATRNTQTTIPGELGWSANPEVGTAVLRYSAGRITYMNTPQNTPLLWDIFRAEGANYWFEKPGIDNKQPDQKIRTSLDLNFRTFDFNTLGFELFTGNDGSSDACFIRLVDD